MSNFWANALGIQPPAAPAPQPVAAPVQPWYAPPVYPQQQPQQFQPQVPQGYPYPGHPQAPQQQAPAAEEQGGWGTIEGSTARAKSARIDTTCPECGGDKMFRPEGHPSAMAQCYSCGYNPRFSQTGGQGGLPSDVSQPATPARQTSAGGANGASQFRPDVIVGHI